jgi:hypothetical protein
VGLSEEVVDELARFNALLVKDTRSLPAAFTGTDTTEVRKEDNRSRFVSTSTTLESKRLQLFK